jgi:hypothetical protein
MVNGYEIARTLHVVATLGIADLLVDGPKYVAELAVATGTHAPTLYRLLRAVASVSVFAEDPAGRFGLTPRGEYLRSDVQGSVRAWAMMVGGPSFWSSWGELLDTVKTGETAFLKVHGMTNWQYRARHADEGAIFDTAMTATSVASVAAIAGGYDFSQIRVLVDVGGGQGILLAAIMAVNTSMHGILFDQPHVLTDVGAILEAAGVADRTQIVSGDFFEQLPSGADAYMLKSVIHDWDDPQAINILRSCRAAMRDGAKLLVVELAENPPNQPDPAKFIDIRMLVMNGGRERTAVDFEQLYAAAGLRLCKVIPTQSPFHIFEGSPI